MEFYVMVTRRCNLKCTYCFLRRDEGEKIGQSARLDLARKYPCGNSMCGRSKRNMLFLPLRKNENQDMSPETVEKVIKYLRNNYRESDSENRIVFTGGEPLLVPHIIAEIIRETRDMGFEYGLQTNGTLLGAVCLNLLFQFRFILVSIDGDEESHDRHRGKGTYRVILENLKKFKLFKEKAIFI